MPQADPIGTQERKRARKAMPERNNSMLPAGVVLCAGLALCLCLYWATHSWLWIALAVPPALLLVMGLWVVIQGIFLLGMSRRMLEPRGVRCLVICSNSPTWNEHIRDKWLPRLGPCAVTLNWSERATWPRTLEVRLFEHFVASSPTNFNPAVLVLRGRRHPQVFRFYYAFQQARHERTQYLEALESEMFVELGL